MRKVVYISFIFVSSINAIFAQQKPQYTQYILNNYVLNPAISGIENYIDFKGAYRKQWSGLENAPKTTYFTIHAPIGKKDDRSNATSFDMIGGNPLGRSYLENYAAADPHHGVGLTFLDDKTGPITNTSVNLTYAYHLGISSKINMAVGVGLGANRTSLNTTDLKLETPNDPAIASGFINRINPDVNAGIWVYSGSYFAGASIQQVLQQTVSFSNNSNYTQGKTVPHMFATAGYRFWATDDITIIPSIMLKNVKPAPLGIDFNTKIAFRDKIWIGATYRKDDSFSGMMGFSFGSLINVSYAYDLTTSALGNVSNGTHEIVLGLLLNNRYKITCPQNFW